MALRPPLSAGPADPPGRRESGTGGAPTQAAASGRHSCWTNAGTYVRVCVCLCICGLRRCADSTTPSYLAVFSRLAREMRGKRDPRCCFYHAPWQPLGWRLSWRDYCCGRLWLDLLAISRTLCSAAFSGVMLPTVPDFAGGKKKGMERRALRPPLSDGPAASRPYGGGTGGAAATPLASNALYAPRRKLRAWPRVCGGGALSR